MFNGKTAAQAIHHEFQDADEANLLEEEGYATNLYNKVNYILI